VELGGNTESCGIELIRVLKIVLNMKLCRNNNKKVMVKQTKVATIGGWIRREEFMIFFCKLLVMWCLQCEQMVVLEGEWKMGMFEGSFETLMKLDRFVSLTFIRDLSLKMIEFWNSSFIGIIAKDVIFPTRLTLLNLEFYNFRYR